MVSKVEALMFGSYSSAAVNDQGAEAAAASENAE